jgi:RimJ/RimL family protein N-acetyltransferase
VELLPYSDADLALTEALECDPDVMRELGGPVDPADIPAIHRRRAASAAAGGWWFTIVPDADGPPVGTIGIWETEWQGERIDETGWMVLPGFHGRGIASQALDLLLTRARAEPRFAAVHAFPGISNGPSNALCRKFGFTLLEEIEGDYRGQALRCNHWVLRLR